MPELLTRLKNVGGAVQVAAFRWVMSADPKVVVGPPFRTIVNHGIQVGIHGDGVRIAPLNPCLHISVATTVIDSFGAKVNGDQRLTREEALRLSTRDNAWFLRMDERTGSIEVGTPAGVAVLNKDDFTVPDEEIKAVRAALDDDGGGWIVHQL